MKKLKFNVAVIFKQVRKRDGGIVSFDQSRITEAIFKALRATGEGCADENECRKLAEKISDKVLGDLRHKYPPETTLHIEQIQDVVEETLILEEYAKTAKAYILYRQERFKLREQRKQIPDHVKKLVEDSRQYFRSPLGEFIYYRSYSRWILEESRRETWIESVQRYMDYMKENMGRSLSDEEYKEIHQAILTQSVMPSMRLMWSAGKAARSNNVSGYNCSYIAPTDFQDLGEIMYISMCGTGVGFSVEAQTVQQFPQIKRQTGAKAKTLVVEDSKEGWADVFVEAMDIWFSGKDVDIDYSKLRPAGARLKTMGGRSSGPEPLKKLMEFARGKILEKQGRRLSTIDLHDIICKIGDIVQMGGVRRSAMISLSDLDDQEMRMAKFGQFYISDPQRQMANNSVAYMEKPGATQFLDEWIALAKSGSGERGIFNRGSLQKQLPERRWKVFERDWETSGTNPCGEILLKSKQFCNLTEVVCRAEDTEESLLKKIRIATILGTYQSTLTHFSYLSKEWKRNCEEERLLGVSLTGQWDCPAVRDQNVLSKLKAKSIEVNREYAKRFGINQSTAITCVKPSGTVSQLVDTASGMHPRHAPHYIRRYRITATDPLFQMLRDQKVRYYPEVGQTADSAVTYVLEFPVQAPEDATFRNDLTALQQLEHWKMVKTNFTEHNPSVTISVGTNEWIRVVNWLYENWDMLGGLSFLPRDEHIYTLAPYEDITKERYEELVAEMPQIDFSQILLYEKDDETQGAKEAACVSGVCEVQL